LLLLVVFLLGRVVLCAFAAGGPAGRGGGGRPPPHTSHTLLEGLCGAISEGLGGHSLWVQKCKVRSSSVSQYVVIRLAH